MSHLGDRVIGCVEPLIDSDEHKRRVGKLFLQHTLSPLHEKTQKCFFFAEKSANAVSKASLNLSFYTATRPKLTIILQELCNFYAQS